MPWSYPNDVPSSMQHFKPEIQQKAISIANAILKSGGSEGVAIATGIKKAKQMSKGGLLKVAFESGAHSNLPNAWKTMGKGVGQGQRQDIPLAKGLPKVKPLNFQI